MNLLNMARDRGTALEMDESRSTVNSFQDIMAYANKREFIVKSGYQYEETFHSHLVFNVLTLLPLITMKDGCR